MKYELQEFKSMVDALHESDGFESWMTRQRKLIENMAFEAGRICQLFKDISMEKDAVLFTRYFHLHQHSLVSMADQVYTFLKEHTHADHEQEDLENDGELSLQRLYNALVSILQFMQTQLKIFFKTDGKVPVSFIEQHQYQEEQNHLFIEKALLERSINSTIITHLITVLRFEDQQPNEEISFAVYTYVLKVQKELLFYLRGKDDETNNYRILKLLTTLNLNSIGIYEHYHGVINDNQLPHFRNIGLQKPTDPIKMSLLLFIITEINSLHALKLIAKELYPLESQGPA
ncbi:hypothetical protein TH53_11270 [Pedobacter lusitanus]|uniref:Contig45, whole genome shotgun sequence n=1 Tax=Pedobacter lusitanus TaxID=1503925 RepID=A0A0D0FX60_9SPHI|nr:hypothetical protein [Pedobacter lusitanus]KIO77104.1 hypothetical protein TH53_11270 [Pedobacter lusitanus]